MKRIGRILSLTVILTVLATMFCFAAPAGDGTLVLNDTYPKDGATGTAVENMGVKLYFDATFTQEKLKNANENAVTLLDEQGKKLPTQVLYSVQEPGVSYLLENPVVEAYPVMSMEEALKNGMTLEESKQRILKRIMIEVVFRFFC